MILWEWEGNGNKKVIPVHFNFREIVDEMRPNWRRSLH